jgi:hypothetical protein
MENPVRIKALARFKHAMSKGELYHPVTQLIKDSVLPWLNGSPDFQPNLNKIPKKFHDSIQKALRDQS